MLNLIAGQLQPTDGAITVDGTVGYLPQELPFVTDLTVAQMLDVATILTALEALAGGDAAEEVFTAIGDDWDIEERCTAQLARLGLDVTLDRAARRAGTAARNVKDAGLPKIVAGKLKRDAQESAARADEVHARRVGDARARLDAAEQAVRDDDTVVLDLPDTAVPAGRTVLSATGLNIRRDGQMLFAGNGIDVDIRGPERIALTGRNGAGKSTLLRMINGDLSPDAGHVTKSDGRIAYLSQRLDLLDEQRSVLENLTAWTPTLGITRRMHLLAQFLFQGNRIELPAAALSGGERLRATLACVLYAEPAPHLLLLDEPTNNLDLVSVAQLESALNAYRGAFIVVSHDDRFLDAIGIERRMTLPETPALSAPAGSAI